MTPTPISMAGTRGFRDLPTSRRRLLRGKASDYLHYLPAYIEHHSRPQCVLYCRESSNNGNLQDQIDEALRELALLRISPVAVFSVVGTSSIFGARIRLEGAIASARKHSAVLVAPSRCRFLRWRGFGPGMKANDESPTLFEYQELITIASGVTLATILHPDASARSKQIIRGQTTKGNRGGRPKSKQPGCKKNQRLRLQPQALELRRNGYSWRAIEQALKVPQSTIRGWLRACDF